MALEYSDDNELIYQAKAVAKDIVNAKYEVTKKVGNFLFLAHSDEEFYQRATAVDQILESTSSRKLASVSDSKAKLVKALYQEWELKHVNCEVCKTAAYGDSKDDSAYPYHKNKDRDHTSQCPGCGAKGPESVVNGAYGMCSACDTGQNTPNPNFRGPKGESVPGQFPYKVNLTDKNNYNKESSKGSSDRNFNLPERVASPVVPENAKNQKLWDKWSFTTKNEKTGAVERRNLLDEGNPKTGKPYSPEQKDIYKLGLLDSTIGGSIGRVDDPEVAQQITPQSVFLVDPHGLYGRDKQRGSDKLKGRKPENSGADRIDPSKILAMAATPVADPSAGPNSILRTHHKCTGNTFVGFDASGTAFKQCKHVHHEGDGCGLTKDVAEEGSIQPGCGQQHIIAKVQTPSFVNRKREDGTTQVGILPHLEDEKEKDVSDLSPAAKQQRINKSRMSEGSEAEYFTNPSEEQVGELPPSSLFLLHPSQNKGWHEAHDQYHAATGGEGPHPANLSTFTIGDKTHRVGDIVSTVRQRRGADPSVEDDLGIVVGASSHRNGEHVRLGRSEGLAPNTRGDSSMRRSAPGEYSVIVHRLNSPKPGKDNNPTGVDPDTNQILPNKVTEGTHYYPSEDINTVEPFDSKKSGKGGPKGSGGRSSKLYGLLKAAQARFSAKPDVPRQVGRPKTVRPTRDNLDLSSIDLNDLFSALD